MKSITYAEFFKGTRIFADMNGWDVAKKPSEISLIKEKFRTYIDTSII